MRTKAEAIGAVSHTHMRTVFPVPLDQIMAELKRLSRDLGLTVLLITHEMEVVKRIANMEQTNPDVIKEVERGLDAELLPTGVYAPGPDVDHPAGRP